MSEQSFICNECYKPVTNSDELVLVNDILSGEGITTTPYHKSCREKNQEEFTRDLKTLSDKKEAQQDDQNRKRVEIATKLSQRTGFLAAAKEFLKEQPIYYDKSQLWWLWNHDITRWELTDETEVLNIITTSMQLYGDVSIKSKTYLLEALRQEGRRTKPKDLPKHWVQFKNRMYDLQTGDTYPSTSEYFCVNPIPWKIGETEDTPTISRLFDEWVGAEHTQTLYEIMAYLCYSDYPIHVIVCLVGSGRNGKSKYLGLVQRFLGKENISSTELEQLFENRFETFKLYKKLACLMGETNFNTIRNTSLLKRLTGQDLIGFEAKGKNPFDDYNYAKILISTNALPTSEDSSDGFYRRWMILDFPNEFGEGKDILDQIPPIEYENLAKRITKILPELLERGRFLRQGTIEERKKRYIETSNPLLLFIKQFCVVNDQVEVKYSTFYTRYAHWLNEGKKRVVSRKEFSEMLERAGHEIKDTTIKNEFGIFEKGRFVLGLKFKENLVEYGYSPSTAVTAVTDAFPISSIYVRTDLKNSDNGGNAGTASLNDGQNEFSTPTSILDIALQVLRTNKEMTEIDFQNAFPELNLIDLKTKGILFNHRAGFVRCTE